ncbi:MAG: type 1 glutamine amidotransferase domain-containing protein [Bacteriovorax sp.]|nr:type 1 glutamine amidotransferase domain-containing protein [Bacteriovorax sp.]
MAKVLIPLPNLDFDPTETAIPWKILTKNSHQVVFGTPDGSSALADIRMLEGHGLGPFQGLRANATAREAYSEMLMDKNFQNPKTWQDIRAQDFHAIILPGGHAKGMRPYLESQVLQNLITNFFLEKKLVGAICHGVVLVSRAKIADTGRSVLYGKKTTALPKWMELSAWLMTCLWLGNYYRTYPQSVQDEVKSNLASSADFLIGPLSLIRDSLTNQAGFVIEDGNFISARWPGDAHRFAEVICTKLSKNNFE